jgi:hypothetical protein
MNDNWERSDLDFDKNARLVASKLRQGNNQLLSYLDRENAEVLGDVSFLSFEGDSEFPPFSGS